MNLLILGSDKYGKLICRGKNYWNSEENPKYVLIYLTKKNSKPCIERLEKLFLDTLIRNKCNEIVYFKSNLDYFHPKQSALEVWR